MHTNHPLMCTSTRNRLHAFLNCPHRFGGLAVCLAAGAIAFLVTQRTQAQTRTWDGGGVNANWSTVANWDNNALPETTADVVFGTGFGSGTSINVAGNRTVNSLTINTITGLRFDNINFADRITLTSGAMSVFGGADHTLNSSLNLGADALWNIEAGSSLTIAGSRIIAESGSGYSLTKEGGGLLNLTGSHTYSGDTIILEGIVRSSGSGGGGLGGGNVFIGSAGIYEVHNSSFNPSIGALSGSGSVERNVTGNTTLTIGNTDADGNFSGVIANSSGTLAVSKNGTGTQILSGDNTYSGGTSVNAGVLRIASSSALGSTGNGTTVSAGAALELTGGINVGAEALTLNGTGISDGGALRNISGNNSYAGTISLQNIAGVHRINSDAGTLTLNDIAENGTSDKILTIGGAGNVIVNGIISGGSDMALAKDGAGTLTLNGANSYTLGTTLSEGTLVLGADNVIPNTGTFDFAGGILDANNRTDIIGPLSLTADSSLVLKADSTAGSLTFSSASWTDGTLTIYGWSGEKYTPGTDDRVYFTADPTASGILDHIRFDGYGMGAMWIDGTGEIVPVPEPINVALGVFGAVFLGITLVRRLRTRSAK